MISGFPEASGQRLSQDQGIRVISAPNGPVLVALDFTAEKTMAEPLCRLKQNKNEFKYSKTACQTCIYKVDCWTKTDAKMKEDKIEFRTLPDIILQSNLSSSNKYIASIILCSSNTKKIKPGAKKREAAIEERSSEVLCPLSHAEIIERWNQKVIADNFRKHIIKICNSGIQHNHKQLFNREKNGKIYIYLGETYYKERRNDGNYYITQETGVWEKGLIVPAIVHQDTGLKNTEKIVIAGCLAYPKFTNEALAVKLKIKVRTIYRIKAKFKMEDNK